VLYGGMFPQGSGATPFPQRFFYGGQNQQRGYAPLRQGPKLGASPFCDVTGSIAQLPPCAPGQIPYATVGVPVGGTSAILFSGELRVHADWLLNHLGIVTFVDASRVQDEPKNPLDGGLEVAAGLGLRYITGFGPLRIDFGWLVSAKDVYTQSVTANGTTLVAATRDSAYCPRNTVGCIHESRWALHVTLGEAY